jgi:hypothetical protein
MTKVRIAVTAGGKLATRSALDLQAVALDDTVRDIKAAFAGNPQGFAEALLGIGVLPVFETCEARDTREAILAELASL